MSFMLCSPVIAKRMCKGICMLGSFADKPIFPREAYFILWYSVLSYSMLVWGRSAICSNQCIGYIRFLIIWCIEKTVKVNLVHKNILSSLYIYNCLMYLVNHRSVLFLEWKYSLERRHIYYIVTTVSSNQDLKNCSPVLFCNEIVCWVRKFRIYK